jgi:alpha-galactosidase
MARRDMPMKTRFYRLDSQDQTQVWFTPGGGMPALLYWGEPLPAACDMNMLALALQPAVPHGGLDVPERVSWLPEPGRGFTDMPGLALRRGERHLYTQFELLGAEASEEGWDFRLQDPAAQLELLLRLRLHADSGVFSADVCLTNVGHDELQVDHMASLALPVPRRLSERLSLTGRWAAEFQPVREPVGRAAWLQESRVGRSSHHAFPGVTLMEPGTQASCGEAWSCQLAWSGNHRLLVQPLRLGGVQLQAGELLLPGELSLKLGESAASPKLHLCRSGQGLGALRRAWHRFVRDRVLPQNRAPRPVQFNTWEATYFDHDAARLQALATTAAALGVERFVLDDGWFAGRRHDRAGLGDWKPCPERYPQGLAPLASHCQALGMSFGLWVEPEGVSQDSALFRAHPSWVLGVDGLEQPLGRHQHVLNMGLSEAREHLHEQLSALLRSAPIQYLKWDMNRDMTHAAGQDGRVAARQHVRGLYQLIDQLRTEFPALEIETCASGGARADLGMLHRATRVWVSDCNDPIERQRMQRALLNYLPPEVMGVHVGDAASHTTGRVSSMPLRTLNALLGHFGLEADLLKLTPDESQHLREAIAFYKSGRSWHEGASVQVLDHDESGLLATSLVAADGSRGWVTVVSTTSQAEAIAAPLRLQGLEREAHYRVRVHPLWPAQPQLSKRPAGPFTGDIDLILAGQALLQAGLALPVMQPGTGVLLCLQRLQATAGLLVSP